MLKIKELVFIFILLLFLLSTAQHTLSAEEESLVNSSESQENCLLQKQLNELENLKNADLSKEEKLSAEEKLKKEIVISLFNCSLKEVDFLKSKLEELSLSDEGAKIIRQELIEKLNTIADYYKTQKEESEISNSFDIKITAKNLKNWREENYKPIQQKIATFILWVNNQALFDTAQIRFDKLSQAAKALKIIDQDEKEIQNLIQKASDILKTAQTNNFLAKQALKNSNFANDALIFIRASLNNLHQVYQVFLELGGNIRRLLLR